MINIIYEVIDNIYSSPGKIYMKSKRIIIASLVVVLSTSMYSSCKNVTGDLDDQVPVLMVDIETVGAITISNANPVYLIYYANSDWTNPWLQHGSGNDLLLNPFVQSFNFYLAAFWDANGNGILDSGDPVTGYENVAYPLELTKITLLPLEWRMMTITLDASQTYP